MLPIRSHHLPSRDKIFHQLMHRLRSHWLRLDQISARNFDKSARRFLLVKNLCSFILTTKPEKQRLISVFPIIKKEPGHVTTTRLSYPNYSYLLLGLLLKDLIYPTILIKTRTMAIQPIIVTR